MTPENTQSQYKINIEVFEGPLDLLLFLINKNEIDIYDIPISLITQQYLQYLEVMESLNLDIAGEFILMAATLAHIKSRMLLPKEALTEEAQEEIDPRAELVAQLLEYQKYKDAAERLGNRELLNRDVFSRGSMTKQPTAFEGDEPTLEATLFQLIDAFHEVLTKARRLKDYEVETEAASVREMMMRIGNRLRFERTFPFSSLFDDYSKKGELIAIFLALLELIRLGAANAYQTKQFGPVYIYSRIDENADVSKYLELVED